MMRSDIRPEFEEISLSPARTGGRFSHQRFTLEVAMHGDHRGGALAAAKKMLIRKRPGRVERGYQRSDAPTIRR
jgi:hypothetical protein